MTSREKSLTTFLRSRAMAFLSAIGSVVMIVSRFPDRLQLWVMPLTVVLVLATGVMMIYANRRYNILRSLSVYFGGLFLIMMGSTPLVSTSLDTGVMAPLVLLTAMMLLYNCYNDSEATKTIGLVFVLVSGAGLITTSFLFYLPVMALGVWQLKCNHGVKPWIAAALGTLTPWWLYWTFSGINPFPPVEAYCCKAVNAWANFSWPQLPVLLPLAFTLGLVFTVWLVNLLKILAYNAQVRAMNALLSLMTAATWIFSIIDLPNALFYLPSLFMFTAFQMGHFFRIFMSNRAYILALGVLGSYLAFYFVR